MCREEVVCWFVAVAECSGEHVEQTGAVRPELSLLVNSHVDCEYSERSDATRIF